MMHSTQQETSSIELLSSDGKVYPVDETLQTRLLLELEQAQELCRSPRMKQLLVNSLPSGSDLQEVPPIAEFLPGDLTPFDTEHIINGMQKFWYPGITSKYVRIYENGERFYLSLSSYWPALLHGVANVLKSQRSSTPSSNEICLYGLQPCVRPEKQENQWRRIAFTQAHLDFVAWHQDQVTLCRKAIECICRAVTQLTGLSPLNIRARVSDARGWPSLLGPHFSPRAIQALRKRLLDPIAEAVALDNGNAHLLAQRAARFLRHLSRDQAPEEFLRIVIRWIETGNYESEKGLYLENFPCAEVQQLVQSCKEMGIPATVDARSARIGYSGLTWQIDCYANECWIEVAGGGDYTDAAILYARLHTDVQYDPATIVVGSAVGVHRALAIGLDRRSPD